MRPVYICVLSLLASSAHGNSHCLTDGQILEYYGSGCEFEQCSPSDTNANCSYTRIQATTNDSFQATHLTHQTARFELDLSVGANETLVFGLIVYNTMYTWEKSYCKVFTACPQQAVDGRQQRIQLRLRLISENITGIQNAERDIYMNTYALYATKTTNGKLCDQPQMRLFLPLRENDTQLNNATSLQLGIRDAANCIDSTGGCTLDPYLRRDTAVGATWLELRFSARTTRILFKSTKSGWKRAAPVHGVKFDQAAVQYELMQRINSEDWEATLRWRLETGLHFSVDHLARLRKHSTGCERDTTRMSGNVLTPAGRDATTLVKDPWPARRVPTTLTIPDDLSPPAAVEADSTGSSPSNGPLALAAIAAAAIAVVALLLPLLSRRIRRWLVRDSLLRVVLLVVSDDLARDKTVARLRQALTGHRAFKRDRLRLSDLSGGVSNLTADLARKSTALIFVSRGADFADLRLDGCRTVEARKALMTVLGTEKCKAGVCYLSSGAAPAESPWAGLAAIDIGVGDLEAAAGDLIAKLRLGAEVV